MVLTTPASAPAQELFTDVRSALDGVYTEGQAEEGRETFETVCADCHGAGGGEAQLHGREFLSFWGDQPLYTLWGYVTTRMPYGAPGSLSGEQYAALVAYILALNGYPTGEDPLPHEPLAVANIDLDLPPEHRRE